jgi:LysR family transcriptional regulator for metE and metH
MLAVKYWRFRAYRSTIKSCETSLDMIAGQTAGRISIGAVSTAKYFVPFAISGFSKLYPNIDIKLTIRNRQEDERGARRL